MEDEEEIILTEAAEELAQQHSVAEPAGDDGSDVGPLGLHNGQLHEIRLGDDIFDDDEAMVVRTDVPEAEDTGTSLWKSLKTHAIYIQCYFVTIACILGTGILGLPVTLARSGFYPFLVSFLIGFVMQALLIYFFTDLLQRAHAYQIEKHKAVSVEEVQLPLREITDNDSEEGSLDTGNGESGGRTYRHIMPTIEDIQRPNLHMLGTLFLGNGWRQLFDIILLLQFIFILISYALAGSEAYAQVLNVKYLYIIPVFVGLLSVSIVFAQHVIQPLVSILTLAKGGILVATVVVTFGVGAAVANEITNDFQYMGQPFLMGTVALGGIMNVMPLMYSRIDFVKTQIRAFMIAVLAGLTTCMILNILWCWSVLGIVPQTNTCQVVQIVTVDYEGVNSTGVTYRPLSNVDNCEDQLSLERSEKEGEIATVPLTKILHNDHPEYNWIAKLIQTFIMISISVSYLTMGSALMHSFLGWLDAQMIWDRLNRQTLLPVHFRFCTPKVCRRVTCLLLFVLVLTVAMLDPKAMMDSGHVSNHTESDSEEEETQPVPQPKVVKPTQSQTDKSKAKDSASGFAKRYCVNEELGDPIPENTAQALTSLLVTDMDQERKEEALKKHETPNNCETLLVSKVNPPIWDNLSPNTRSRDVKIQRVVKPLVKGLIAIAKTEKLTRDQEEGIALVANGLFELHMLQRELIKPELNKKFVHLFKAEVKPTKWLFGDDLAKQGFVVLLDKISSLLLNLEGGVFVFFMLRKSQSQTYSNLKIPCPVSRLIFPMHYVLLFYFTFAVVYDVALTVVQVLIRIW